MPALQVYDAVEKMVGVMAPDVPFQQSVSTGINKKNLPDVWATVEFAESSNQRLSIGNPALWREYGQFVVLFLGRSGYGERGLLAVAQAFERLALDYKCELTDESNVKGNFRIENASPPNTEPFENGNWLACSVSCVYTYDRVRATGATSV